MPVGLLGSVTGCWAGGSCEVPRGSPAAGHCAPWPLRAAASHTALPGGVRSPGPRGVSLLPARGAASAAPAVRARDRFGLLSSRDYERLFLFNLPFAVTGQAVNYLIVSA